MPEVLTPEGVAGEVMSGSWSSVGVVLKWCQVLKPDTNCPVRFSLPQNSRKLTKRRIERRAYRIINFNRLIFPPETGKP
jgi:hypothetical protein